VAGWTLNSRAASAAVFLPLDTINSDLCLLLRRQLWTPTPNPAFLAGSIQSRFGSFLEHGLLEFSEGPLPSASSFDPRVWSCQSLPSKCEIPPRLPKPLHDGQHVTEGAREPIKFPHHQYVVFSELIEKPVEFGPVPASTRGLLAKDASAAGSFQRHPLRRGVLVVGGDSSVADQHCTNVSPIE